MMKNLSFLILLTIFTFQSFAQNCTTLGQNATSAFPVCGTAQFTQSTVPICGNRNVPNKMCPGDALSDKNPFWYKFTCFTTGTLGFKIMPKSSSSDYDWQLFDITGRNATDVYTDASLIVACNWSGETGTTGASSSGTSLFVCATTATSPYRPLFSAMPTLIAGHEYLLLVSHYSDTQAGYSLSFGGGTASITDVKEPHLASAETNCAGNIITVKLNKKVKCSSLDITGAEFSITPALATITKASSGACNTGFDMDSVTLTLSAPLPLGTYKIAMQANTNGTSISDVCDRVIPVTDTVSFSVVPPTAATIDSASTVQCSPNEITVYFNKAISCNSVAADGSDFSINGPSAVTVSGAACSGNKAVKLKFTQPIQTGGTYTISLKTGSDNNTIMSDCLIATPANTSVSFIAYDTVSADFSANIIWGCKTNTVVYSPVHTTGVTSWLWKFDNTINSKKQDTSIVYDTYGDKTATLIASNGVCKDTSTQKLLLNNEIKSAFEATSVLCPGDEALVANNSIGAITTWNWDFGNGKTSTLKDPLSPSYTFGNATIDYRIRLIVGDATNCKDTSYSTIKIVNNCNIAVAGAFTPNNDGLNDYLHPVNAYKAKDLQFKIFNRFGQLMYETKDILGKWDGNFKGKQQPSGVYVWVLQYTDINTNKKYVLKGSSVLIR